MAKKIADCAGQILASPLFEGFDREEALGLIEALEGEIAACPAGTHLAAAGQSAPRPGVLFLLLEGQIQSVRYGLHGEQRMIDYSMPGSVLGSPQALAGEETYHNALLAGSDCLLLRLRLPEWSDDRLPVRKLERNLLRLTVQRNILLMRKVDVLSGRSVREKLLTYLRYESELQHSPEFDVPLNRQELADYIYVDRTTLSTELGKMQREGLIRFRRKHFVLLTAAQG